MKNQVRFVLVYALTVLASIAMQAQQPVAATPPMGWNSWDAYGLTITEPQFRANVQVLHDKLQPSGWRYAVIDEGWYFFNPQDRDRPDTLHYSVDPNGRYTPVPARFPTAVVVGAAAPQTTPGKLATTLEPTSFAALGAWVHAQGLLFGIHIVRGIPRVSVERNLPIADSDFHAQDAADTSDACPWDPTNWGVKDNAAGQAWYDSLITQYTAWGVDLLKVDCISDHPYKQTEIRMLRRAIDKVAAKTGHTMVLSLSPGPTALAHAEEVVALANMWRISDDEWDVWQHKPGEGNWPQTVLSQFPRLAAWEKYAGPGHWPDADMLPFGELAPQPGWGTPRHSRLTPDETLSELTLWAMARSPLILGANLTELDDTLRQWLTQPAIIAVDQHSTESAEVLNQPPLVAWRSHLQDGRIAIAIFNTSDATIHFDRALSEFDVSLAAQHYSIDDVWSGTHVGDSVMRVAGELRPHACVLYMLR